MLEEDLGATVREFVESLRKVGVVVNTSIVMTAVEGIVAAKILLYWLCKVARSPKDGLSHCFIEWAMLRGKGQMLSGILFQELQEIFLANIKAEVLMNDVPYQLVFNWTKLLCNMC